MYFTTGTSKLMPIAGARARRVFDVVDVLLWLCRVSDEKDARGYLQALAQKMNDELDTLRTSGVPTVSAWSHCSQ